MPRNVGTADRWVRVVVGVALLFLFSLDGNWRWLGLLAAVPFGTALLSYCPLWSVLRINTAKPS